MYRTKITLTVLSEDPISERMGLIDVVRECDDGDYVLHSTDVTQEKLTNDEMAHALLDAGSDPEFFQL